MNTRLAPVPPVEMGVLMRHTARLIFCTLMIVAASMVPAQAQGLGDLLKGMIGGSARSSQGSAEKQRERQELLSQIYGSIQRSPDDACAIPRGDIERWAEENVAKGDLLATVRTSVFGEPASGPPKLSGLDALMEKTRQDTAQLSARNAAVYAGGQVPVGDQTHVTAPEYSVDMTNIKATERIDNGLKCSTKVKVSSSITGTFAGFWFPLTYTLALATSEADGWLAQIITGPENFSEQYALTHADMIRIQFHGADMSLAEARAASAEQRVRMTAEKAEQARREAARAAYQNSPAGRAQEAAKNRALSVEYRRLGLACQNHGGTWGVKWDANTVVPVPPGEVPADLARLSIGCYHL